MKNKTHESHKPQHGQERLDGGPDRRLAENREPGVTKDGSPDHRFDKRASDGNDPDAPKYNQTGKIEANSPGKK